MNVENVEQSADHAVGGEDEAGEFDIVMRKKPGHFFFLRKKKVLKKLAVVSNKYRK